MFSYIDEEFGDYFIVDVDGNFFLKQVSFIQEVKKLKKKPPKEKILHCAIVLLPHSF